MKKIILWIPLFLAGMQTQAQAKLTKNNVLGNWALCTIDMPDVIFYDLENDTISISQKAINEAKQNPMFVSVDSVKTLAKQGLEPFKQFFLKINPDATLEIYFGVPGSYSKSTYVVDEEHSTIIVTEKSQIKSNYTGEMIRDRLRLYFNDKGIVYTLLLKKQVPKIN